MSTEHQVSPGASGATQICYSLGGAARPRRLSVLLRHETLLPSARGQPGRSEHR